MCLIGGPAILWRIFSAVQNQIVVFCVVVFFGVCTGFLVWVVAIVAIENKAFQSAGNFFKKRFF